MKNVTLLYIAGIGRNGSTLLGRVLGENENCICIGEALSYMLNSNVRSKANSLHEIESSPFWKAIFEKCNFSFISSIEDLLKENNFNRLKKLILNNDSLIMEIVKKIDIFLEAVSVVGNSKFIIDTSKQPNIALLLSKSVKINVFFLHLVRSPAAVAASRSYQKFYLGKVSFSRIALRWIIKNQYAGKLKKMLPYYLNSYENFCEEPFLFIKKIANFIQLDSIILNELKLKQITFHEQNLIAGNPDKYQLGLTKIKLNNNRCSFLKNIIINTLTFPWIVKYKMAA